MQASVRYHHNKTHDNDNGAMTTTLHGVFFNNFILIMQLFFLQTGGIVIVFDLTVE